MRGTVRSSLTGVGDANAARRNGVFTNLISLEETLMLAVYRGVAYDTDKSLTKEAQYRKVEEVYRGVKHTKIVKVEEVQK